MLRCAQMSLTLVRCECERCHVIVHKYYAQRRENASNCAQLRVQRQRSLG